MIPNAACIGWAPDLLAWMITGHVGLAVAYLLVPVLIMIESRRHRLSLQPWLLRLFALALALGGVAQVIAIWTLFHAAHWFKAIELNMTSAASLLTLAVLPFVRIRSELTIQWWLRARKLKHEQNSLRTTIGLLFDEVGRKLPPWPEDDALPPPPEV